MPLTGFDAANLREVDLVLLFPNKGLFVCERIRALSKVLRRQKRNADDPVTTSKTETDDGEEDNIEKPKITVTTTVEVTPKPRGVSPTTMTSRKPQTTNETITVKTGATTSSSSPEKSTKTIITTKPSTPQPSSASTKPDSTSRRTTTVKPKTTEATELQEASSDPLADLTLTTDEDEIMDYANSSNKTGGATAVVRAASPIHLCCIAAIVPLIFNLVR